MMNVGLEKLLVSIGLPERVEDSGSSTLLREARRTSEVAGRIGRVMQANGKAAKDMVETLEREFQGN